DGAAAAVVGTWPGTRRRPPPAPLRPGRDGRRRRRPGHLGPVAPAARDRRPMTHDRARRHARARRIGALAGALLVLAVPASGAGERGPREPERGPYRRLPAGPTAPP